MFWDQFFNQSGHHFAPLQEWQDPMTSAKQFLVCSCLLSMWNTMKNLQIETTFFWNIQRLSLTTSKRGTRDRILRDPPGILQGSPETPHRRSNQKRETGPASSIAMDNFPRPWPEGRLFWAPSTGSLKKPVEKPTCFKKIIVWNTQNYQRMQHNIEVHKKCSASEKIF